VLKSQVDHAARHHRLLGQLLGQHVAQGMHALDDVGVMHLARRERHARPLDLLNEQFRALERYGHGQMTKPLEHFGFP